jgi:hypothetical protein
MNNNPIIKLSSNEEKRVLHTIELYNVSYILCEDVNNREDCDIYRMNGNDIEIITDHNEYLEAFNKFLEYIMK